MGTTLQDHRIEQIIVTPPDEPTGFLVHINFPDLTDRVVREVASFLYISNWDDLRVLADRTVTRHGYSFDMRGFAYRDQDEPTSVVAVWIGQNEPIILSEAAFTLAVSRLLNAAIDGAVQADADVTREAWWPIFLNDVQIITERAGTA